MNERRKSPVPGHPLDTVQSLALKARSVCLSFILRMALPFRESSCSNG